MALLAVAKSNPKFSANSTAIPGATDDQSVASAETALCNPDFIETVDFAGYTEAALVLLVFGCAYLVADQRGLKLEQRAAYV